MYLQQVIIPIFSITFSMTHNLLRKMKFNFPWRVLSLLIGFYTCRGQHLMTFIQSLKTLIKTNHHYLYLILSYCIYHTRVLNKIQKRKNSNYKSDYLQIKNYQFIVVTLSHWQIYISEKRTYLIIKIKYSYIFYSQLLQ